MRGPFVSGVFLNEGVPFLQVLLRGCCALIIVIRVIGITITISVTITIIGSSSSGNINYISITG